MEWLYGLFAGTPDTFLFRYFLSCLAGDPELVALVIDATSAFLQSDLKEKIAVRPPKDLRKPGIIWQLFKACRNCVRRRALGRIRSWRMRWSAVAVGGAAITSAARSASR